MPPATHLTLTVSPVVGQYEALPPVPLVLPESQAVSLEIQPSNVLPAYSDRHEPLSTRRWTAGRAGLQHRDGPSAHTPRLTAIDGVGVGGTSEAAEPTMNSSAAHPAFHHRSGRRCGPAR